MDEMTRVGAFGGVVGRLVRDATSPGTAFTGFVLGVILLASGFVCRMVQADAIGQLFGQIVMAAALARFAMNGYSGEYRGTILSTAGGTWPQTLMVAGRYLTLQLLWVVPTFLLGWSAVASVLQPATNSVAISPFGGSTMPAAPTHGAATLLPILGLFTSGPFLWSIGLLFFGMLLLPPVFLIVSVRSEKFGDIFSPALWGATFGGRLGDLYTLYAVQAGGVMMGMMVMAPLVLLGFSGGSELGILAIVVAMGFLAGLTVTLMGRLCGFFAFGEESPAPASHAGPHGPQAAGPRAIAAFPGGAAAGGAGFASGASGAMASQASAAMPEVYADAAPGEGGDAEEESPLPPLLDAADRAAAARRRFETDRDGAIAEMETLRAQNAPSPQILHALALMLQAAGRVEEGSGTAREAIGLCLKRGHTSLAAEVFAAYWKQSKALGVTGDQIDLLAASLFKSGDLAQATTAFGVALNLDHGDRKAIKGLLQIADQRLHREAKPKDAARIYTFLLQYAGTSPFAEDMKRGLAEAEARLKRAV
ncbi:MAG TPA: hypothetical protein VFQ07_16455 [Candidatus Polarisedimenticolia bacterium]|nr:hypothetical protein [Candidatus Polarisedimenticolia bacterium]